MTERKKNLDIMNKKMLAKQEQLRVYDEFLNKVIMENQDEYQDPTDIVTRFETLKSSLNRL